MLRNETLFISNTLAKLIKIKVKILLNLLNVEYLNAFGVFNYPNLYLDCPDSMNDSY